MALGAGEGRGLVLNGDGVSVREDGQALETDAGDGCAAVRVRSLPPNGPLKNKQSLVR